MLRHQRISLAATLLFPSALAMAQAATPLPSPDATAPTHSYPPTQAKQDAPNIVLIVVDDAGFSTTSTFGGPVQTPNFERLAKGGVRFNQFHVNSLCSPTRAALLSGRNNHQIGFGTVAEAASDHPGYNSLWPKESASVAEVLKENGYSTAAFGKWHNTPMWQVSPAGPFDRWPTGLGFEHFYGFLAGLDNQYYPRLFRDQTPVEPPKTVAAGYHFTSDITDEAIHWLHQHDAVAPRKPFFLYYATGAVHSPIQVPKKWIAKYKGKFDQGWDKLREENFSREKALGVIPANAELTPRPDGLPAWDSLTADQKKLLAHQAEVFAAFVEHTDHEIGRLLDAIREEGQNQNTLVIELFGDNGGSAEGGLLGTDLTDENGKPATITERLQVEDDLGSELFQNHYAAAWAWAFSTPFQGTKQDAAHLGGTRDPLVVSWPKRIRDAGSLRSQFQHVNDVAPTIYEAASITPPEVVNGVKQTPLEGTSFLYAIDSATESSHHRVQYFSTSGNRAIYKDGWWAGNRYAFTWEPRNAFTPGDHSDIDRHPWELYNLNEDYSQAHDLATKYPEKLHELQAVFESEAHRNQAYPLLPARATRSWPEAERTSFTFRSGVDRLPNRVAPQVVGRHHVITADVRIPETGAEGVILAQGSRYGGFTIYVKNGRVIYETTAYSKEAGRITSVNALPRGKSAHIEVEVTPDVSTEVAASSFGTSSVRPGSVRLRVNGQEQQTHFKNVNGSGAETLDVGSDLGSAVSTDYTAPYRFTGTIDKVTVDLVGGAR